MDILNPEVKGLRIISPETEESAALKLIVSAVIPMAPETDERAAFKLIVSAVKVTVPAPVTATAPLISTDPALVAVRELTLTALENVMPALPEFRVRLCAPPRVSAKVMSPDVPVVPPVRMDVAAPNETSSLNITADPFRPPVAVSVPFRVIVLLLPESIEIRPASFPVPAEVLIPATLMLPDVVIVTSPPSCWETPVLPRVSINPAAVMSPVVANKARFPPGPSTLGVV